MNYIFWDLSTSLNGKNSLMAHPCFQLWKRKKKSHYLKELLLSFAHHFPFLVYMLMYVKWVTMKQSKYSYMCLERMLRCATLDSHLRTESTWFPDTGQSWVALPSPPSPVSLGASPVSLPRSSPCCRPPVDKHQSLRTCFLRWSCLWLCVCMRVCVCACVCVCMFVCACMFVCVWIYMHFYHHVSVERLVVLEVGL